MLATVKLNHNAILIS